MSYRMGMYDKTDDEMTGNREDDYTEMPGFSEFAWAVVRIIIFRKRETKMPDTNKESFGGELAKQLPVKELYADLAHPALSTVG